MNSQNLMEDLRDEVAGLSDLFRRRLMEDKARASLYAAMQEDVRQARDQLRQKDVEGVIRESLLALDRLHDEAPTPELVESVLAELLEVFARRGLRALPDYPQFDSSIHEVVGTVAADETREVDEIVETRRCGYRFGDRLLRPAHVVVAVDAAAGTLPASQRSRTTREDRGDGGGDERDTY